MEVVEEGIMRARKCSNKVELVDGDDEDGGAVGGAGGIADSFNHTSGPRQFTSFCHQVCQERRTGGELLRAAPGGAGGVAGKCVQRKPGVGEDFGTLIGCGRRG